MVAKFLDDNKPKSHLGRFPFVTTGRPDHCRTSHFNREIGFFRGFLLKNYLLPAHCLGFDWSGWIVLINSEILITTGMVWPVKFWQMESALKKRIRTVSNLIDLIQFHLIFQTLAKFSGVESKRTVSKFRKNKTNIFVLCSPSPWSGRMNLGSFMSQSCNNG